MSDLTRADLEILSQWDTPTICNALEFTNPERRGYGFTIEPLVCLDPSLKPMVGYARTARLRAATAPSSASGKGSGERVPYYEYVAFGDEPKIVVIEDVDPKPGIGAFWGEVHTAVHKGLGALGVVTNGSFRDVTDSAPGFQVLGGLVGPSHAHVHIIDFNIPITVQGMSVEHGDIIHADQHGAVIVPVDAVKKIPDVIDLITRKEGKILDAARRPDFSIDVLKQVLNEVADIH